MKNLILLLFILYIALSLGCKKNKNDSTYKLETLLMIDSPKVILSDKSDTLIEYKDTNDYFGLYTFDKNEVLRLYRFFINEKLYKYLEEYDQYGNVVRREGNPLLFYEISQGIKDTVIFNGYLYGLNSKYEYLWLETNFKDTIEPRNLYQSKKHSNLKCFSIKLPVSYKLDSLIVYTKGTIVNNNNKKKYDFVDTSYFNGLKL
jgi:hypothetical protein